MADKKSEAEHELPDDAAHEAGQEGRVDVLTNAVRRLDNRFRGRPNDPSLIGQDMPEEDEDENDPEAAGDDADEDADKDDDWPEPKGTKLW
jgi:hypothetical protein